MTLCFFVLLWLCDNYELDIVHEFCHEGSKTQSCTKKLFYFLQILS
jgi:hypothetical protein